jgi:hypothetical protein
VQTGGAEPPLLLGPALGVATVGDTKSVAVSHPSPPANIPAHTGTIVTTTLCYIAGILNIRAGMTGQCNGLTVRRQESLDATQLMLSLRAYGRAEVQLYPILASTLDSFVPDKSLL